MSSSSTQPAALAHVCEALGGRMVSFAGYDLPLQFSEGIVKEHLATRSGCGLFEVSHLRQALIVGPGAAEAIESQVAADIRGLSPGRQVYTQMLLPTGGMVDDLLVTRLTGDDSHGDRFLLVNNASRRDVAWPIWQAAANKAGAEFLPQPDHAIFALQGPKAARVIADVIPEVADRLEKLWFLDQFGFNRDGNTYLVTRSGYTGEDGFEFYLPPEIAEPLFRSFAGHADVTLAGLGARDSLRLEACLALYGQDLSETMSPVEAGLAWSIPKVRRERADFPGAEVILGQLRDRAPRRRIAVVVDERGVPRSGWHVEDKDGQKVGDVTSGAFGPTTGCGGCGIALCLVTRSGPKIGDRLFLASGKRRLEGKVVKPPFVPHHYRLPPK